MRWKAAAVLVFVACLGGCAATTTTSKVAVDYNRIFAKSRNEVLLTNILRASAREPLQFSTMGTVTGGVRNTGSIKLPIPSLIGAGPTILSPEISLTEGINPSVTIIPLSNKEFTEGILKPVSPETINFFLDQGWDSELILQLVVGGVVCPNGAIVFNRGDPGPGGHYDEFVAMFQGAPRNPIRATDPTDPAIVRVPAKEGVALLRDGAGKGRIVNTFEPVVIEGKRTDLVDVTISKAGTNQVVGLSTAKICENQAPNAHGLNFRNLSMLEIVPEGGSEKSAKAILRSVESILYFLGETQRKHLSVGGCNGARDPGDWPYYTRKRLRGSEAETRRLILLKINRSCDRQPVRFPTFAQTGFNGERFYVLRQNAAGVDDRSLTTLSLLSELIALQTSESSITSATPIVAIGPN